MRELLAALGKDVKKYGKNWLARCPIHADKDFAFQLSLRPNNSVGGYCHGCGASALDLYKHYKLDLRELYGNTYREKDERTQYIPQSAIENFLVDRLVMMIYRNAKAKGEHIKLMDKKRAKLASARMKGLIDKYGVEKVREVAMRDPSWIEAN